MRAGPSPSAAAAMAVAAACLYLSLFSSLGARPLLDQDEGRYAAISAAMARSGDWIVPRLNGLPYLEKPPAIYWAAAASIRLLGASEFSVRLAPALLTALCAAWVSWTAGRLWGRSAALHALLLFLSLPAVLLIGRAPLPDVPLALGTALGTGAWLLAAEGAAPRGVDLFFWAGLALGFLAKGPVSLLLTLVPILAAVRSPAWSRGRKVFTARGFLLAAAVAAPWFWAVSTRVPGALRFFFWEEHVERFIGYGSHRPHGLGPLQFAGVCLALTLPWSVLAFRASPSGAGRASRRVLAASSLLPLVLFLPSSSRLATYFYPGIPALALLLGGGIPGLLEEGRRSPFRALGVGATALGCAGVAVSLAGAAGLDLPGLSPHAAESLRAVARPVWLMAAAGFAAPAAAGLLLLTSPRRGLPGLAASLCLAGAIAHLALGRSGGLDSTREAAQAIGERGAGTVVNVGRLRQSLEFYLGRPVHQYQATGEMLFGKPFDREGLLMEEPEELRRLLDDRGELLLVCEEEWVPRLEVTLERPLRKAGGSGRNRLFLVRAAETR